MNDHQKYRLGALVPSRFVRTEWYVSPANKTRPTMGSTNLQRLRICIQTPKPILLFRYFAGVAFIASARCSAAAAHASPLLQSLQSTAPHSFPRTAPQKSGCPSKRLSARSFPPLPQNQTRSNVPPSSLSTKSQIP